MNCWLRFTKHYSGDQLEDETGGKCGTHVSLAKPEERAAWKT
jgi:hypothetical protein